MRYYYPEMTSNNTHPENLYYMEQVGDYGSCSWLVICGEDETRICTAETEGDGWLIVQLLNDNAKR